MKESVTLSEGELALVEALQVSPRAPWSAVARATGGSPVTAARRWQHLVEQGAAWVTGTPGVPVWNAQCLAYVRIRCSPGRNLAVARTLAADPHALSVELTAGDFDLFVTVAATDLQALARYVLERVDLVPGITDTQTQICTHLYREGSRWRLGTLPHEAAARLPARPESLRSSDGAGAGPWTPEDVRLFVQLGLDGRSSYAALAAAAGVSEATARRRVAGMLGTGAVALRAEVAAGLTGWRVPVMLGVDAPSARLAETAAAIARLRQVRLCATLAGTPAIIVSAWLRDLEGIHDFETTLAKAIPQLTVASRLVTLRTVKRTGRLLDEDGRAVGAVPMDIWSDPVPAGSDHDLPGGAPSRS
jgi:DNA-binding Lrp family transcriptional regulator